MKDRNKTVEKLMQEKIKWDIWEMANDNQFVIDRSYWCDQWDNWCMVGGNTKNGRLYFIECLINDIK